MCGMTHFYARQDLSICVTWLIFMRVSKGCGSWNVWHGAFISNKTMAYVWHDSFLYATWLISICDMTHFYMRHDSFLYATWLVSICDRTCPYVCLQWLWFVKCVTWCIHMCDMTRHSYVRLLIHTYAVTHSCVWHDPFVFVSRLVCMCGITHSYLWHHRQDSFIRVTWLIRMCDMTHSYAWCDPFICVTWIIHVCDMTHS